MIEHIDHVMKSDSVYISHHNNWTVQKRTDFMTRWLCTEHYSSGILQQPFDVLKNMYNNKVEDVLAYHNTRTEKIFSLQSATL